MSLNDAVATVLPENEQFELLHLQSIPRKSPNIFVDAAGQTSITIKALHLICLAQDELIQLGLEIIVYVIIDASNDYKNRQPVQKIIYVSKIDTTGLKQVRSTPVIKQVLEYLIKLDISHYVYRFLSLGKPHNELSTKKLLQQHFHRQKQSVEFNSIVTDKPVITRIQLFTRAEKQYLFPLSYRNPGKHVLSDRGLLSWWLKLLDSLMADFSPAKGTLAIPGEDQHSIKQFLVKLAGDWQIKTPDSLLLAVNTVPLFPDDPKGRFLEHLVVENRVDKISTAQFWNELAARQEFRLTNIVGIVDLSGAVAAEHAENGSATNFETLNLFVDDLDKHGVTINNFSLDLIIVTRQKLKYLKSYITGELYDSIKSAKSAYRNLQYLLNHNCNYLKDLSQLTAEIGPNGFKTVVGKLQNASQKNQAAKTAAPVTVLSVKKKRKLNK